MLHVRPFDSLMRLPRVRHFAITVELCALVEHEARGHERAAQPGSSQQFDALARNYFTGDVAADRESDRCDTSGHHRAWCDQDFISCNLTLGFALDHGRFSKI
jgi:hypothetical protein